MTDPAATRLDLAHAAMEAAPDDDRLRLRFHERIADAELFLMLTEEPKGETLSPETFALSDATWVLAFDTEERLAAFAGRTVPYAALPGRVIVAMLAGRGAGLGLNLEVAPSSTLLPPESIAWLAETLAHGPAETTARIRAFHPPGQLPEALLTALDSKLGAAAGLARMAFVAGTEDDAGARSHILAFVGTVEGAEPALARAVSEALTFSGLDAGTLDVAFFRPSDPAAASLARVGLRIDLPEPPEPPRPARAAPGSDPDKPPILR